MNSVVYYPYTHPSSDWLKLAALCWDKVYVLGTYDAPDDPEASALDMALGGLLDHSLYAENVADTELVEKFIRWVDARQNALKQNTLKSQADQPLFGMYPSKSGPTSSGEQVFYLLAQRGLAKVKWPEQRDGSMSEGRPSNDMIYMPQDIALYYLSLCAEKAAQIGNRDIVAADQKFTDVIFYDQRSMRGEVASTILNTYLPRNFYTMSPEQIKDFRELFGAQRLKYEQAVQSICNEFGAIASEGELISLKKRVVELANERIEEVKQTYYRARIETAMKSFGLTLSPPAIMTSVASILGIGLFAPAAIGAALSLFAASTLLQLDKAKTDKSKSPWSYVLQAAKIG